MQDFTFGSFKEGVFIFYVLRLFYYECELLLWLVMRNKSYENSMLMNLKTPTQNLIFQGLSF